MQKNCSHDNNSNNVQVSETVEVVQNPAFDRATVDATTKAGSKQVASGLIDGIDYLEPNSLQTDIYDGEKVWVSAAAWGAAGAGGDGGAAEMVDYLEPDDVQPTMYEGAKQTQQLVATGKLVLDLEGYVVDEESATATASSPSMVVYAAVIDDVAAATSQKPAIVHAVPCENGGMLLKTATAVDGTICVHWWTLR